MFFMGLKEMRNKIYLSIILLTPPTVLLLSWLYFTQIFDPDGSYDGKTRQNGVFFKSYFNFNQFKNSQGIGIDFDKKALKVAEQNKSNLLNENRLNFCHADFSEFNTINYDLIVCNPPYVSTSSKDNMLKDVQDFEPEIALFAKENGLRCFKMVLDNLIKYENKKQLIIFEIGYNQLKPIQKLLKNTGFQLISVEKDISDIPRCIVTKRI